MKSGLQLVSLVSQEPLMKPAPVSGWEAKAGRFFVTPTKAGPLEVAVEKARHDREGHDV